jgi:hypothetical protein
MQKQNKSKVQFLNLFGPIPPFTILDGLKQVYNFQTPMTILKR